MNPLATTARRPAAQFRTKAEREDDRVAQCNQTIDRQSQELAASRDENRALKQQIRELQEKADATRELAQPNVAHAPLLPTPQQRTADAAFIVESNQMATGAIPVPFELPPQQQIKLTAQQIIAAAKEAGVI
jgi:hypothetical protein